MKQFPILLHFFNYLLQRQKSFHIEEEEKKKTKTKHFHKFIHFQFFQQKT